jgi:DNA polymerase V
MRDEVFALVDVNNMYVSCERAFCPTLQNKPVVVLSNNDGAIVARSQEVKDLGVKMGVPFFQIAELVKEHGIVALSSNYTLYGDMSNRLVEILRGYSPSIEVYSIDESFVNLRGLEGLWASRTEMGQDMRKRILQWTALPVCVGVGSSKTLAKLANHVAKKVPLFKGVCDFTTMSKARMDWLFERIEVGEVWGVGRRIAAKLEVMGIHTVQDLKNSPTREIKSRFGVVMERTVNELNGLSCLALEEVAPARKEIVSSKSFGEMVTSLDELSQAVSLYLARATEKLRAQRSTCGALHVFIMTNRFRENDRQYSNGLTIPLVTPTDDSRVLGGAALHALELIYRPGYNYKKAGVMLMDLNPKGIVQGSLFANPWEGTEPNRTMEVLDSLNKRFGRDCLQLASSGTHHRWQTKADRKTPRYTTSWNEFPIAKAN